MSTIRIAPTPSAICRKRFQSITSEYAEAPATIIFGLCSWASRSTCVVVDHLVSRIQAVGHRLVQLAAEVDRRAVRQVAAVREPHAEDGVPGFSIAMYTAALAWLPECGWTLANCALNSALARSIASCSAMSTYSQPP